MAEVRVTITDEYGYPILTPTTVNATPDAPAIETAIKLRDGHTIPLRVYVVVPNPYSAIRERALELAISALGQQYGKNAADQADHAEKITKLATYFYKYLTGVSLWTPDPERDNGH